MKPTIISAALAATLLTTALLAQTESPRTADAVKASTAAAAASDETRTATEAPDSTSDSRATEADLRELLRRFPPEVGRVLKLDPSLLSNATYLATYPDLAAFVKNHPEVAHSPHYYLESVSLPSDLPIETASMRMWRSVMEDVGVLLIMSFIGGVLIWIIRTMIDHRRWSRLSRVQADVHNKLLDRLTSNDELLAYIQTTPGRRFLESAPITIDPARPLSAPLSRILWSVQAGVVLAMGGVGLQIVSRNVERDVAQPLFALGIVALCVGAGFVLSGVISYLISRRLGLFSGASGQTVSE